MQSYRNVKIEAKNFKCFGESAGTIDGLSPINVFVGRNNSGKSSFLDIISYVIKQYEIKNLGHKGEEPRIYITDKFTEAEIRGAFPTNTSGGEIQGNHFEYGMRWLNQPITWLLRLDKGKQEATNVFHSAIPEPKPFTNHFQHLVGKNKPFAGIKFRRISAERDIRPEGNLGGALNVDDNGAGLSFIIRSFLTKNTLDTYIVEKFLLEELNKIFEPDCSFIDITVQEDMNGSWEIYLGEKNKGRIPLSKSGSGIKTVIFVLVCLYLIPKIEETDQSNYIFAFEELENNLHPALQRRLLSYLRNIAVEKDFTVCLTTHSNVVIDMFSRDKEVNIIHVNNNGSEAFSNKVTTYVEHKGILDDLDVRASDLLQSNGIVWVEGPSDRLYFNHWIDIWSEGELKEGSHYQCVFYGGRLLSHLSGDNPDIDKNELIKILRVNTNAIMIIDSDKRSEETEINSTKQRIVDEFERMGGYSWVTLGREVENYIPREALAKHYKKSEINTLGKFFHFKNYLNSNIAEGEGERFMGGKVLYAEKIIEYINKDNLTSTLDMQTKLNDVCKVIRKWNGLIDKEN